MSKSINKYCLVILIVWALMACRAEAQVWQDWLGIYNGPGNSGDKAYGLVVDDFGNVCVTGHSNGGGTSDDYCTIKYDAQGDTLWVRRYHGSVGADYATALAADPAGNVYVTGYSQGSGYNWNYATIKYSPNGDQLWVKAYNGPSGGADQAFAIGLDADASVYVTGRSMGNGTGFDYATIKYSSDGALQWAQRYDGPGSGYDVATALAVDDANGFIYVTGGSTGNGGDEDFATLKYDFSGATQWVERFAGAGDSTDRAIALKLNETGNPYVAGSSIGLAGNADYEVIKYTLDGRTLWRQSYNGAANDGDFPAALAVDFGGNAFVTGSSFSPATGHDYATVKIANNGQLAWVQKYSGGLNYPDFATCIALDAEGNIYISGSSAADPYSTDYATIKYANSGELRWTERFNGLADISDKATDLALDRHGNVCLTGFSWGLGTNWDYATIKYTQMPIPNVLVNLLPDTLPIILPDSGGSFSFEAAIINNATDRLNLQTWSMVGLPNGFESGPMAGPYNLNIPAGGSYQNYMTQLMPAAAPAGLYAYRLYVGFYPDSIWTSDTFNVFKMGDSTNRRGSELSPDEGWLATSADWRLQTEPEAPLLTEAFNLPCQVKPNPCNARAEIHFTLPFDADVAVAVFDLAGREMARSSSAIGSLSYARGEHAFPLDAAAWPSGVYFYRVKAESMTTVGKMVVLK